MRKFLKKVKERINSIRLGFKNFFSKIKSKLVSVFSKKNNYSNVDYNYYNRNLKSPVQERENEDEGVLLNEENDVEDIIDNYENTILTNPNIELIKKNLTDKNDFNRNLTQREKLNGNNVRGEHTNINSVNDINIPNMRFENVSQDNEMNEIDDKTKGEKVIPQIKTTIPDNTNPHYDKANNTIANISLKNGIVNQNQEGAEEMNNNGTAIADKIIKIKINEKNNRVDFYTESGNKYVDYLERILNNKKSLYRRFKINGKCKELATSFLKKRKLERLLNPVVIEVLNNNEDIYKYIECINNKEKLPFELEHNIIGSCLEIGNRNRMKKIANCEEKIGVIVKRDKDITDRIKATIDELTGKTKKKKNITEEIEFDNKYKNIINALNNSKEDASFYRGSEIEKIELQIQKCANWYLKNGKYNKAQHCIDSLKLLLNNELEKYYKPQYYEEMKRGNKEEAEINLPSIYNIKKCNLDKLIIKNEMMKGNKKEAEELYKQLLKELDIKLDKKELKKSLINGLLNGSYYVKDKNGKYIAKRINGNERILQRKQKSDKNNSIEKDGENKEVITETNSDSIENRKVANKKENMHKENEEEENKHITKAEIEEIIQKSRKMSNKFKFQKGGIIAVVNALANYLKENKDTEVKKYLEEILKDVDSVQSIDLIKDKIGKENMYNPVIFDYISSLYREGLMGKDEEIIAKNDRKSGYYTYILNKKLER